jgi:hypothetical protein
LQNSLLFQTVPVRPSILPNIVFNLMTWASTKSTNARIPSPSPSNLFAMGGDEGSATNDIGGGGGGGDDTGRENNAEGDKEESDKVKDRSNDNKSTSSSWKRSSTRKIPSSSNHSVDFVLPPGHNDDDDNNNNGTTDRDGSTSSKYDTKSSASASSSSKKKKKLAYKRSMSSATHATQYDSHLLKRAVSDAGRWAYGIILVEVWALNSDQTFLYRPDNGYWIDPVYHNPRCHRQGCEICRLVDPTHPKYVEPRNQSPGQGLPGVLWSEVAQSWTKSFRETLAGKILGTSSSGNPKSSGGMSSSNNSFLEPNAIRIPTSHFSTHILWRSIPQLDSDPDQPWNPRLKLLATLGLGLAAAVPFNLHGDQGIVIYMARDNVDRTRLQSESNEAYLVSASDLIAAAYALRGPRQQVVRDRHAELSSALHRVRRKVLALHRQGLDLKAYVDQHAAGGGAEVEEDTAVGDGLRHRKPSAAIKIIREATQATQAALATSVRKAKGAGAPIPPVYSRKQSLLTFFGSFATLLAITSLSDHFQTMWGPDYGIVLGYVRVEIRGFESHAFDTAAAHPALLPFLVPCFVAQSLRGVHDAPVRTDRGAGLAAPERPLWPDRLHDDRRVGVVLGHGARVAATELGGGAGHYGHGEARRHPPTCRRHRPHSVDHH